MTLSRYLSGYKDEEASEGGPLTIPPFLFAFLIIFRFVYLLLIFSLPVASLVVLRKQSFIFSQNFIPFLELILFKSIILRLSKQPVIVYRWGGGGEFPWFDSLSIR